MQLICYKTDVVMLHLCLTSIIVREQERKEWDMGMGNRLKMFDGKLSSVTFGFSSEMDLAFGEDLYSCTLSFRVIRS